MTVHIYIFIGKKGKNTPVSATESTVPLPVKKETNMLKRGQDDDAKYLCEYNIVVIFASMKVFCGYYCDFKLNTSLEPPLSNFELWN